MTENEFDAEIKYKLFRSVKEILHPSISKRNISNYKITLEEGLLPVRIFYPKKVTGMNKVILYIRGNGVVTDSVGEYSDICKIFSEATDCMIIAIEYEEKEHAFLETYQEIYKMVCYLYERLLKNNMDPAHIILMGDSTGGNIVTAINAMNKDELPIKKEILFYPTLSLEYFGFNVGLRRKLEEYFSFIAEEKDFSNELLNPLKRNDEIPDTILLVGKVDSLKEECEEYTKKYSDKCKYVELPFSSHGFLKNMDKELSEEVFHEVNKFIA